MFTMKGVARDDEWVAGDWTGVWEFTSTKEDLINAANKIIVGDVDHSHKRAARNQVHNVECWHGTFGDTFPAEALELVDVDKASALQLSATPPSSPYPTHDEVRRMIDAAIAAHDKSLMARLRDMEDRHGRR
jgi:hypothetical protein